MMFELNIGTKRSPAISFFSRMVFGNSAIENLVESDLCMEFRVGKGAMVMYTLEILRLN